jgi:WD40 repeat protein
VASASFSHDGARIVTGSHDKTVRVWDARNGTELVKFADRESIGAVAFNGDGSRVLTGASDGTAKLWHAASGAELMTVGKLDKPLASVVFAPGKPNIVVVASEDGVVKRFDSNDEAATQP